MKKKIAIIICSILLLVALCVTLVACDKKGEEEQPLSWKTYIDEVANYYYRAIKDASGNYMMTANLDLYHVVDNVETQYSVEFNIAQNISDNRASAFELRVVANNAKVLNREVFYFASNNQNMYLLARGMNDEGGIKYHFENTPIFDLYDFDLVNTSTVKENVFAFFRQTATGCKVNADRSIYTISFDMSRYASGMESKIKALLSLIPAPIVDELNKIFNTNIDKWIDVIKDTSGTMQCEVHQNRMYNIKIDNIKNFTDQTSQINKVDLRGLSVSKKIESTLSRDIEWDKGDFTTTKIATLSSDGTVSLIDSASKRTAVKYTFALNTSIDLLQLARDDFNFSKLDDRNYFHLRVMHTCDSSCTGFCDVASKNKLQASQGAVLDIAFSPKDFGTKFVYISVALKSLVGQDFLQAVAGNQSDMLNLVLTDYTLLTLDTQAYADANNGAGGKLLIEAILAMTTCLDMDSQSIAVNIDDVLQLLKIENKEVVDSLLNCGGFNIDNIVIDFLPPQFGYPNEYNIARETLYLIDYDVAEIKNHNTGLLMRCDPSINWSFDDYALVNQNNKELQVHNIYAGNSLVYGVDTPIAPEEINNIKGYYLNYNYTDVFGDSEKKTGTAKILDIIGANNSLLGVYQPVKLKVQLPSNWNYIIKLDDVMEKVNQYLYAYVDTNIMLTSVDKNKGIRIDRADVLPSGETRIEYQLKALYDTATMLDGAVVMHYSDGKTKTLPLSGSCSAVTKANTAIFTTYYINKLGDSEVIFDYAGIKKSFTIRILAPDEITFEPISNSVKTFKKNVGMTYSEMDMYDVATKYGESTYKHIPLSFDNYFIDNRPLSESSKNWETYYDVSGEKMVKFISDGIFDIEIRAYGHTIKDKITVTSNVVEPSQYKLVDTTNSNQYYATFTKYEYYKIMNTFHGASGLDDLRLTIQVSKGSVNGSGFLTYEVIDPSETTYKLLSVTYMGNALDLSSPYPPISLPPSILKPYALNLQLVIYTPGRYRIKTSIGRSLSYTKDIVALDKNSN